MTPLPYNRLIPVMVKRLSGFVLLLAFALPALTGEVTVPKATPEVPSTSKETEQQAAGSKDKHKEKEKEKAKAREREEQRAKAVRLEVARLVKQLEGDSPEQRKGVEKRLAEIGKPAIGLVVKALGHDTWDVREAAQRVIRKIGRPAVPGLTVAVGSKDLEVSTRAGALLKEILGEGYLGVGLRWLQADEREVVPDGAGATASSIVKDGPGAKAGIEIGDIIHQVDGKVVKDVSHMIETVKAILPGTKVKVIVYRGRRKTELVVNLGRRPSDEEISKIERQ